MATEAQAHEFAVSIAAIVTDCLGECVAGVYIVGSVALGDVQPTSDLDMAVVARGPLAPTAMEALTNEILRAAADAPVRGLEFVLYTTEQAAHPDGNVTLNINAGPQMRTRVGTEPGEDFWFVVDTSILRDTATPLIGPPVTELFGEPFPALLLAAIDRSLQWHRDHGDRPHANVLTACRAWRFAEEGVWSSKTDAGSWAAARSPEHHDLIIAALDVRAGRVPEISATEAAELVERVRARVRTRMLEHRPH